VSPLILLRASVSVRGRRATLDAGPKDPPAPAHNSTSHNDGGLPRPPLRPNTPLPFRRGPPGKPQSTFFREKLSGDRLLRDWDGVAPLHQKGASIVRGDFVADVSSHGLTGVDVGH
jgi:hypothetical protein